jgi:integrase
MTPSEFGSKKFRNLYKYPGSRFWVYRRYSQEKGKEFFYSTKEETSEKNAHAIGEAAYHKWLGLKQSDGENLCFDEYIEEILARKLALPDADFSPGSKRSFKNSATHLKRAFGHLYIDQVVERAWEDYYSLDLARKPDQKFFNRRKTLIEIMRKAQRDGLIKRLPVFNNPDPKTDAGQYLKDDYVERVMDQASPDTALLILILWKQGARPSEALQYRWEMIRFEEGKHGAIHIPAEITKTRRARTIPLQADVSDALKERQARAMGPWVFPSPVHEGKGMVEYKTGWVRACRREACQRVCLGSKEAAAYAGQPGPRRCPRLCRAVPLPTIYDLRRTFITNQAKKGSPILYVARYTDTSVTMIERFYAKVNLDVFGGIIE